MSEARFHRLTVAEVIVESDDARSFVFEVPAASRDAFAYRPGQFLTLSVPCGEPGIARCYSLSSAPGIDAAPKVTVKRVQGGRASNWLCDRVRAGDGLDVLPPAGVFTPRALDGDLLLLAAGSGITPVLSILKSALVHGRGMLTLIYANRDERSVIFRDELQRLAQRHPGRLRVIHWLDSVQGVPQQRHLEELVRPFSLQETFICGPGLFMESALAAMLGHGLPRARVHVERFASLPDAPARADAGAADATVAPPAGAGAAIEALLDGESFAVDSAPGETLLEAMLREGMPAPHSCRQGQCGACMCRVERGAVTLDGNQVLDEDELAAGWTLACCARPASDALRVVFPD